MNTRRNLADDGNLAARANGGVLVDTPQSEGPDGLGRNDSGVLEGIGSGNFSAEAAFRRVREGRECRGGRACGKAAADADFHSHFLCVIMGQPSGPSPVIMATIAMTPTPSSSTATMRVNDGGYWLSA